MTYYTSGSAPSTPEPPTLLEAVARSLKLQWQKSAGDVSGYILEMDDESKVSMIGKVCSSLEVKAEGSNLYMQL